MIKLSLFIFANLYGKPRRKCDCPEKGLPQIGRVFWRIRCRRSLVQLLLFCCASSKPEPKLPAGDFHGGVGGRDASFGPSVRLLRRLKGFLLCFTHVKLKATLHSHYITLVHPLEYIWPFGVYGGTSSCSLRNDQNYPLPSLPFLSTRLLVSRVSSPLRCRILEDIEFGWMDGEWRYTFHDLWLVWKKSCVEDSNGDLLLFRWWLNVKYNINWKD